MKNSIYTFCLPDIGEGVVEGEVVEWLKQVGDTVSQDEPVVTVMTDKATVEMPATYPGTIVKHYYQPGQIAHKDKPLYDIQLAEGISLSLSDQKAEVPTRQTFETFHPERMKADRVEAIPKVRRQALEQGINIEDIVGTGKDGRVTEADLSSKTEKKHVTPSHHVFSDDEERPLVGVRALMAKRMDQRRIPQFSYFEQLDVTRLIEMRTKFKVEAAREGIRLSYVPFLIRALVLTIKKHPLVNASIDIQKKIVRVHKKQNIGIAMATKEGLIVPVLKGVESMGVHDLVKAYEELKKKIENGKLVSADMKEATITLSNFGVLGGEGVWATPMISEPEVAILAVARIREAPVVRNHEVVVRSVLPLSWSFDHRVIDGEEAAAISQDYCTFLRNPALLL
ncbi:MAG: dihydrolipoamide acetyltransferase family protein [Parachlamydiaceae bacterium]